MSFDVNTPEGFAKWLADGVNRSPGLYGAKRTEMAAFEFDVERPEKVTAITKESRFRPLAAIVEPSAKDFKASVADHDDAEVVEDLEMGGNDE